MRLFRVIHSSVFLGASGIRDEASRAVSRKEADGMPREGRKHDDNKTKRRRRGGMIEGREQERGGLGRRKGGRGGREQRREGAGKGRGGAEGEIIYI